MDAATVGVEETFTVIVLFDEQPAVVPVTVYVVVIDGVTAITVVVCEPGNQAYVVAPLAVKVVLCPAQILKDDAEIFVVGVGVTFIVTVLGALLQLPVFPVMV